jgi:hypothetical protein
MAMLKMTLQKNMRLSLSPLISAAFATKIPSDIATTDRNNDNNVPGGANAETEVARAKTTVDLNIMVKRFLVGF